MLAMAGSYLASTGRGSAAEIRTQAELEPGERTQVVEPRAGITVVTTDSNVMAEGQGYGPRSNSELVAFNPNGTVRYFDDSHFVYWDVDPSPVGSETVLSVASDHLRPGECNATTTCTRNVVERVNLTTGEITPLYSRITPLKHSTRWHDVDRVDETHIAIADIANDRLFVVNTTSGLVEWEWDAQAEYDPGSGGPYPRDWTHINDVEILANGTFMASLRNQDQVVFIDREQGLLEEMTLGRENEYDVLYEQHNPDFIPAERGGPAVVVADSENNRVVEYQREDGSWERSWLWKDAQLQWPRDADRLPNGHTLIADSNGNRIVEVDQAGEIVWSVDIAFPYEVERLGTGDESAGGQSARALDLRSQTVDSDAVSVEVDGGLVAWVTTSIKRTVPGRLLNAVMYVSPIWMDVGEVLALLVGVVSLAGWAAVELRWSGTTITVRSPFVVRRK